MKSKLFIVFTMVVLFISGCRSSEKKEEVVQDANNYAEYNEELETTSSNTVLSDDLLYRGLIVIQDSIPAILDKCKS